MKSALIECITRHLGGLELANVGVDLDSSLIDLGYDSFKFVELVINIEARFGMEFADEDLDYRRFDRVSDLWRYVEGRVAAPALGGASSSVAESIRHDEV